MNSAAHTQLIARRGELMAELFLQQLDPLFVARSANSDFGLDFFLGLRNSEGGMNVIGIELKATEAPVGKRYRLRRQTHDIMANSNIPILLLVVDVKTENYYFAELTVQGQDVEKVTNSVPLEKLTPESRNLLVKRLSSPRAKSMIQLNQDHIQYTGDKAELIFEHWCREIKAHPQKARFDEMGGDFFVTFRSEQQEVVALDLLAPELLCIVQVKGSDTLTTSAAMKLSTWLWLIHNPLPAFVVLIHYDGENLPKRAYVMPLDEERIAPILKELREANSPEVLLKRRSITARAEEEISPNGEALREAVRRHVGDPSTYHERKMQWSKRLGYETSGFRITVSFPKQVSTEDLVDFAIGLRTSLPADLLRIQDNRFGIARDLPFSDSKDGNISTPAIPPSAEVRLRFTSPAAVKGAAEFECQLYHPLQVFPFLKNEPYRIRLKSALVDFFYKHSEHQLTMDFSEVPVASAPLHRWIAISRLSRIVAGGHTRMRIETMGATLEEDLGSIVGDFPPALALPELHKAIEWASFVSYSFGCEIADLRLADLLARHEQLKSLYAILSGQSATLGVSVDEQEFAEYQESELAFVVITGARLGDTFFVASAVYHGRPKRSDLPTAAGRVVVQLHDCVPEIVEQFFEAIRARTTIQVQPIRERAIAWAQGRGYVVIDDGSSDSAHEEKPDADSP